MSAILRTLRANSFLLCLGLDTFLCKACYSYAYHAISLWFPAYQDRRQHPGVSFRGAGSDKSSLGGKQDTGWIAPSGTTNPPLGVVVNYRHCLVFVPILGIFLCTLERCAGLQDKNLLLDNPTGPKKQQRTRGLQQGQVLSGSKLRKLGLRHVPAQECRWDTEQFSLLVYGS